MRIPMNNNGRKKARISVLILLDSHDLSVQSHFHEFDAIVQDQSIETWLVFPEGRDSSRLREVKRYIQEDRHIGYIDAPGKALNKTLSQAQGDYAVLLTAGMELQTEALGSLCSLMEEEKAVAAFSCLHASAGTHRHTSCPRDYKPGIQRYEYIDGLFGEQGEKLVILDIVKAGAQPFDENYSFLLGEEAILRFSKEQRLFIINAHAGNFVYGEKEANSQYRQAVYEEERALKDIHIRYFLSEYVPVAEHLQSRILLHSKMLSAYYKRVLSGDAEVEVFEFERQVFFYSLLTAKIGDVAKAKEMLQNFFSICHEARRVVHLYRFLLLDFSQKRIKMAGLISDNDVGQALISVVVPLYNQGQYLEEAVRSVLYQTQPRWEMIIVNDGSTDRSLSDAKKLLSSLNDPRIRIVSQANMGKGKTRNRGVRETTAPFVCVLDADDMICSGYFSTALDILNKEPDVGWVCPKTLVFGGNNHLTWTWEYDFFSSLLQCPAPSSAVYRRAMWEEVQGYDEDMIDAEDYVFWVKAGEAGWRGKTTEDVLFVYRHAFQRFGCRPNINIKRKQQYIAKHSWWYKELSAQDLLPYLTAFQVMIFPEDLLNWPVIEEARSCYGNKIAMKNAVDAIRSQYEARQ